MTDELLYKLIISIHKLLLLILSNQNLHIIKLNFQIRNALKPEATWGPALDEDRVGRYHPIHEQVFTDIPPNGATNMGYVPEKGEKGGVPYIVDTVDNSYNHKL